MEIKNNNYKFCEIFKIKNGLRNKKLEDFKKGSNSKFIPFKSIFNSKINKHDFKDVQINKKEKQNLVKKDDLIINLTSETKSEIGFINIYKLNEKVYLNSFCKILRFKDTNFDALYFKYLLTSNKWRKKIISLGQGITRINLSIEKIKKLNINYLIDINKQKLIGNFFEKIDDHINLFKKKSKLLDEYNSFLLKKIFNNLNENQKEKIKNIFFIKKGKLPKNNILKFYINNDGNNFLIKTSDFNSLEIKKGKLKLNNNINKDLFYHIKKNELVMTEGGTPGKISIIKNNNIYIDYHIYHLINITNNLNNYLLYSIHSKYSELKEMVNGITISSLSIENLKNLEILIFKINDQKLIINFFNKIYKKIDFNNKKINLIKEYKNKYLNILFN